MVRASAFLAAILLVVAAGCASPGSSSDCTGTSRFCNETCTDVNSDHLNCGSCGQACASGQVCSAGTCALTCQAGLVNCGGKCVDPQSDRAFCGASGTCTGASTGAACDAGQVCSTGTCQLSCQAGLVNCGGKCVDPQSDRAFCGASGTCTGASAGVACGSGEACNSGSCQVSCTAGSVNCGGQCINPQTDHAHCGASGTCSGTSAGTACGSAQVCTGGACMTVACSAGLVQCGSDCVDAQTDRYHCGASGACSGTSAGAICGSGQICSSGSCQLSCQPGLVNCGGTCVNPQTDRAFCGASGSCTGASAGMTCAAGQACNAGACQASCQADLVNCGGSCVDPQTNPTYCGATGTCAGASAGAVCGSGQICSGGTCQVSCPPGTVYCGGQCVNPQTDRAYCGASGSCTGASAGSACGAEQVCTTGACSCPAETVRCGVSCVDPQLDSQYCGASGTCTGASAGTACQAGQTCVAGTCGTRGNTDIDWRPVSNVKAPHFLRGSTTLAHIVFDGTEMVDQCALGGSGCEAGRHTGAVGTGLWTRVGLPGATSNGMWNPPQSYSGPFSSVAFWVADPDSKAYLDQATSGDFLVCARFKPGRYPGGSGATKVIIASGNPEYSSSANPNPGGWSLMQMHRAFCFHYHDSGLRSDGEWMSLTQPSVDSETVFSQEWTWMCGGRNGASIRELWESASGGTMLNLGAGVALGPYQPAPASQLPSIGAYSDGNSPLVDGGVYEIIIKREAASFGNMFRTVAQASGGIRANNSAPVWLTGADGEQHAGAPSTVKVQPGGSIVADQTIWVPEALLVDPTVSGECYGMVASSPDWTTIPANSQPLRWSEGAANSYSGWGSATANQCVRAYNPDALPAPAPPPQIACGTPPPLAAGTRYTFLNCFNQTDLLMRIYVDGTLFATSAAPIPLPYIPHLDSFNSTFGPDYTTAALGLKIHRVFACRTPDPSTCR